jgi:hypothetical protein
MGFESPAQTIDEEGQHMAATETAERRRVNAPSSEARRTHDETKHALKTTEFAAMVGVIAAILIATWVSDSLNDVRAWTLVAAVAIGYMISRGLAKSGTKYAGSEDPLNRDNR